MRSNALFLEGGVAMAEDRRTLLSIGAFFIILVVSLLLALQVFNEWTLTFPLVLLLFGVWMLALAAMRGSNPDKYARSAFSTMSLGLILIAVGGAWYLFGIYWLYSLVVILLVFGALAVAAALKRK
jgi:hypothetical protein